MTKIETFTPLRKPSENQKQELIEFLHHHLEGFGDPRHQIKKAIDYSLKEYTSFGGFISAIYENEKPIAAVVVNQTGMGGYIPENILVYIATHADYRGKGLGRNLMEHTIGIAQGDIALHVEPDNPAKRLYEKLGFTNKYLEMRLTKH
ncbi:MAG: GNAT family N-acetyltransferase [Bacteroidia bacterium]|nr:GNAT family N-acetyltransferase [Bacteroidia bacterium]